MIFITYHPLLLLASSVSSTTLWVGHLSKLATKDMVKEAFEDFGQVKSVEVSPSHYLSMPTAAGTATRSLQSL